jgi:HlyD family secretion protein
VPFVEGTSIDPTEIGDHKGARLMNLESIRGGRAAALFCAVCAALACMTLAGCGGDRSQGFAGSGTLEATEVTVSAQTAGQILELARDEGSIVAAGDTLARIDVEKLVLQRRQMVASIDEIRASKKAAAEAVRQAGDNLENAAKSFERISGLRDKGTATQQQYDDAQTRHRLARSQVESAKAQGAALDAKEQSARASIAVVDRQIRDGVVVTPVAGVVAEKYVERGEYAPVGGPLFKVADTKTFWLKIYVSEKDLGLFKIGDAAEVRVDAVAEPLAGVVSWVSPEAEFTPKNVETKDARAELVYAVKVTVKNPSGALKIGMPAEVHLK